MPPTHRNRAYRRSQRKRTLERYLRTYKLDAVEEYSHHNLYDRPGSCSCTKRQKGNPKHGLGMCSFWDRSRIYAWRKQVKALRFFVLGGGDINGDEVTLFHYKFKSFLPK